MKTILLYSGYGVPSPFSRRRNKTGKIQWYMFVTLRFWNISFSFAAWNVPFHEAKKKLVVLHAQCNVYNTEQIAYVFHQCTHPLELILWGYFLFSSSFVFHFFYWFIQYNVRTRGLAIKYYLLWQLMEFYYICESVEIQLN